MVCATLCSADVTVSSTLLAVTRLSAGLLIEFAVTETLVAVQTLVWLRSFAYVSRLPAKRASPQIEISGQFPAPQICRTLELNSALMLSAVSVVSRLIGTPIRLQMWFSALLYGVVLKMPFGPSSHPSDHDGPD